jgi:hypothetical protein
VAHRLLLPPTLVIVALATGLTACDDTTLPVGFRESLEADAILRSAAALPSLADLAARADLADPGERATLDRALELWATGSTGLDRRGAVRRRVAAAQAAPVLALRVPHEQWSSVRVGVEDWMTAADVMLRHLTLPSVQERIIQARVHLSRADLATSDEVRVYYSLLAMSELVETSPRYVARSLAAEAATAVSRAEARSGASEPAIERARRLADWAARAVEAGDHMRAIQRSFYAIQLVEGQ